MGNYQAYESPFNLLMHPRKLASPYHTTHKDLALDRVRLVLSLTILYHHFQIRASVRNFLVRASTVYITHVVILIPLRGEYLRTLRTSYKVFRKQFVYRHILSRTVRLSYHSQKFSSCLSPQIGSPHIEGIVLLSHCLPRKLGYTALRRESYNSCT